MDLQDHKTQTDIRTNEEPRKTKSELCGNRLSLDADMT